MPDAALVPPSDPPPPGTASASASPPERRAVRDAVLEAAAAFGGYLACALALFPRLVATLGTRILADDAFIRPGQSDAYTSLWNYWWVQKAISAGTPLLHSDWVLPPTGADLRFQTHVLLPSALTHPIAALFGPVVGFNAMVLLLVSGGAFAAWLFLRRGAGLSRPAAFVGGALFGFSPYFLFKAHAHVNLVGAAFWATALGAVLTAYLRRDFPLRRGALLAAATWATFWTSFLEFFMLGVVLALVVIVLEIRALRARETPSLADRARLLAPLVLGLPSVLPFVGARSSGVVRVDALDPIRLADLFVHPPRLGVLAGLGAHPLPEYWGTYLPLSLLVPAIAGALDREALRRARGAFVALAAIALLMTLDVGGVPSRALRALPMGEGLRVLARFLPFATFFLAALAAQGVERLAGRLRGRGVGLAVAAAFAAVFAIETYPVGSAASEVASTRLPENVRRTLDPAKRIFVVPRAGYLNVHDTYQVALDWPAVGLSYLAREDQEARAGRLLRFPRAYGLVPTSLWDPALIGELRQLGVGYLLVEGATATTPGVPGRAVYEWQGASLWAL